VVKEHGYVIKEAGMALEVPVELLVILEIIGALDRLGFPDMLP
jgi:hypothetical protein